MKTKEELSALKEEVETLNKKLAELTDEELAQVTGGEDVLPDAPVVEPDLEPDLEPKCESFKPLVPLVIDPALGAH